MNSRYDLIKRVIDIAVAVSALILLLPLFLIVAIMLKMTGDHEVIYTQYRIGYRNRPFRIFKFASMRKGSDELGSVTFQGDPRVLPIGRVLRATKINELPQLINVLRGDMSIVGPRPLVDEGFRIYPADVQDRIYAHTKPGLTGLASVIFRNEEELLSDSRKDVYRAYREDVMPLKGSLELWYAERQRIGLDLRIIVSTAVRVLLPRSKLHRLLLAELPDHWKNLS